MGRRNSQQDNNNGEYPNHVPDGGDPIENGGHPVPKCVQNAMAEQDACKGTSHLSARHSRQVWALLLGCSDYNAVALTTML